MLLKIIEGVTHINPKVLKTLAITSNVLLVIGIICLIMLKLMLAIAFFVVSLTISLVIFCDYCYRSSLFCIILKFLGVCRNVKEYSASYDNIVHN